MGKYLDPVEYAHEILGIELIPIFQKVLRSILNPPYKTMVLSGHKIGKTNACAVAINWFFDTFDPCQIVTTAPTKDSVEKVLWREVRLQRMNAVIELPNVFIGPSAPEMKTAPDHWAYGFTATKSGAMQGRHHNRPWWTLRSQRPRSTSGSAAGVPGSTRIWKRSGPRSMSDGAIFSGRRHCRALRESGVLF